MNIPSTLPSTPEQARPALPLLGAPAPARLAVEGDRPLEHRVAEDVPDVPRQRGGA